MNEDTIEIKEEDIDAIENNTFFNNYDTYQQNIDNRYENFENDIDFNIKCLPLLFFEDYENIKILEHSNKIILPKSILYQISNYENMTYPLHLKINDKDIVFSVYEFYDFIDNIYIPNKFINMLNIEYNNEVKLTILKEPLVKGEYVKLQPHSSEFLDIPDIKSFLENNLKKLYSCLKKNDTIDIPSNDIDNFSIYFDVLECKPNDIISIIDTNLEVDFEKPKDYQEPKIEKTETKVIQKTEETTLVDRSEIPLNQPQQSLENKPFVPFSGKGYSLKD